MIIILIAKTKKVWTNLFYFSLYWRHIWWYVFTKYITQFWFNHKCMNLLDPYISYRLQFHHNYFCIATSCIIILTLEWLIENPSASTKRKQIYICYYHLDILKISLHLFWNSSFTLSSIVFISPFLSCILQIK